jgi:hypothetical protein
MMKSIVVFTALIAVSLLCLPAWAGEGDTVEESATGKFFPKTVSFEYDGGEYALNLTGVAARKKMVFKVYGVAHYMDTAEFEDKDAALAAALEDKYAKQLVLDFARGVDAEKIQKAFREGFEKHASETELAEITGLVDDFIGYFGDPVEEDDQYVFRWLPGGVLLTSVKGVDQGPITNATFATVLWRVWLAKGSIVKRDKLVKLAIPE